VAAACGVSPSDLTILYAPTGSVAGTAQIAARVLEVALHKAHTLHFALDNVVDGFGIAPLAPPVPDLVRAMGRTNDAIIYGGRVQLFVRGSDAEAKRLAEALPSSSCSAYGKPFADIFAAVNRDFYKVDPMLFSPAAVVISNLDTGATFRAGKLAPDIVDASFH
jgi:methenyltetrahydromethanopterin cyclohydrolase